jgi:hypothetical protein
MFDVVIGKQSSELHLSALKEVSRQSWLPAKKV